MPRIVGGVHQSERTRKQRISSGFLINCNHNQTLLGVETWPQEGEVECMKTGLYLKG